MQPHRRATTRRRVAQNLPAQVGDVCRRLQRRADSLRAAHPREARTRFPAQTTKPSLSQVIGKTTPDVCSKLHFQCHTRVRRTAPTRSIHTSGVAIGSTGTRCESTTSLPAHPPVAGLPVVYVHEASKPHEAPVAPAMDMQEARRWSFEDWRSRAGSCFDGSVRADRRAQGPPGGQPARPPPAPPSPSPRESPAPGPDAPAPGDAPTPQEC